LDERNDIRLNNFIPIAHTGQYRIGPTSCQQMNPDFT
jgi:hypothetical protein